jgi:hypothetical protein
MREPHPHTTRKFIESVILTHYSAFHILNGKWERRNIGLKAYFHYCVPMNYFSILSTGIQEYVAENTIFYMLGRKVEGNKTT